MPLMPVMLGGRIRMIEMKAGADAQTQYRAEEENLRRASIWRRRMYYDGSQYDQDNAERASELGVDLVLGRLPEHERLHAYSTQLQECIDFLADQLAEKFSLQYEDAGVQAQVEQILIGSDQFTGMNQDDEVNVEDLMREALLAGDVPVEILWNPVDGVAYLQAWDSEQVEFQFASTRRLEAVIRTEVVWATNEQGEEVQVREHVRYSLKPNGSSVISDEGVRLVQECVREVFWDDEESPREVTWLGVPVIPWGLLIGDRKSLRAVRGESLMTDQAMESADRYNANEQVGWLIARYNSHGNLAVVGDAASLKLQADERVRKDVADVLAFPGGTSVSSLSLSGDTSMIEHQKVTLAEAMYNSFGLTRVEPDTISTLGGISGYALEILNRKTEGTFRRVRRSFGQSIKSVLSLALDCTAYWNAPSTTLPDGTVSTSFAQVDPTTVFPNRRCEVVLGTGYIVDGATIRADFTAKLLSRATALKKLGYTEDEIADIDREIDDEAPPAPEVGLFGGGAGSTVGQARPPQQQQEEQA